MIGLFILVLVISFLTFRIYQKKGFTSSCFIFLLYTFSCISAVILTFFYGLGNNMYITDYNIGYIFLLVAILLFLYPFYDIKDDKIEVIIIPKYTYLKLFAIVLTLLSLFSIVYFLPIAKKMIFIDIVDIAQVRIDVAHGKHPFIENSIYNTIAGTSATFYTLQLLFFFIFLVRNNRISYLMLLSSFSYPLFVLAYMGRDGILFWVMTFISFFLLFKNRISKNNVRKLKKILLIISIPFTLIFIIITIGRFVVDEYNQSENIVYPILNYLGQGPINFSELYNTDIYSSCYGKNLFPIFFEADVAYQYKMEKYSIVPWVFKTFVSPIYLDFGPFFTLLIGVILISIYNYTYRLKKQRVFSLSLLIIYTLFFTIYSQGIFYFRQMNVVGNLYIIVMITLAFFVGRLPKETC